MAPSYFYIAGLDQTPLGNGKHLSIPFFQYTNVSEFARIVLAKVDQAHIGQSAREKLIELVARA